MLVSSHVCREDDKQSYPVYQVEDQAHGHAELLEVELAIVVDIGEVPHALELVVAEVAVLEHGGCLGTVEVRVAVGERAEDFPVLLNLILLDSSGRHCGRGGGRRGGQAGRRWRRWRRWGRSWWSSAAAAALLGAAVEGGSSQGAASRAWPERCIRPSIVTLPLYTSTTIHY